MKKRMQFILAGTAIGRLEAAFAHRRHFNSLKALLYEIGRWCFEARSDGVFSSGVLRLLPLTSHLRTLLYSHLPALLACGAAEALGPDTYRFVGFHEYNLSARQLDECRKQAQEDWRTAKRRQRAAHAVMSCVDSMKAQPHEKPVSGVNSRFSSSCPAQPTQTTATLTDVSVINPSSVETKVSGIDSATSADAGGPACRKSMPEPMDKTLAQLIERAQQSAERHQASRRCAEIPEKELLAVERELTAGASGQAASAKPVYPVRRARKPKRKTALNEQVMEAFKQKLRVHLSPRQTLDLWREMQRRQVCAEDLQYAAWSVDYQRQNKRHIGDPLAYARKIVLSQASFL